MTPDESAFLTAVILTLMGCAWLLTVVPRCDHAECAKAHQTARIKGIAERIEKDHITFHDRLRPQPTCPLCQARKRDDLDQEP